MLNLYVNLTVQKDILYMWYVMTPLNCVRRREKKVGIMALSGPYIAVETKDRQALSWVQNSTLSFLALNK